MGGLGLLGHVGDEPVATAVNRLDDPLISTSVADRAPSGLDPAGQRRLGDEPVPPDLVEEFGLRHDTVPVAQQICQDVEDLGLHAHDLVDASQLDALEADLAVAESHRHIRHHRAPWTSQLASASARMRLNRPTCSHATFRARSVNCFMTKSRQREPPHSYRSRSPPGCLLSLRHCSLCPWVRQTSPQLRSVQAPADFGCPTWSTASSRCRSLPGHRTRGRPQAETESPWANPPELGKRPIRAGQSDSSGRGRGTPPGPPLLPYGNLELWVV